MTLADDDDADVAVEVATIVVRDDEDVLFSASVASLSFFDSTFNFAANASTSSKCSRFELDVSDEYDVLFELCCCFFVAFLLVLHSTSAAECDSLLEPHEESSDEHEEDVVGASVKPESVTTLVSSLFAAALEVAVKFVDFFGEITSLDSNGMGEEFEDDADDDDDDEDVEFEDKFDSDDEESRESFGDILT